MLAGLVSLVVRLAIGILLVHYKIARVNVVATVV